MEIVVGCFRPVFGFLEPLGPFSMTIGPCPALKEHYLKAFPEKQNYLLFAPISNNIVLFFLLRDYYLGRMRARPDLPAGAPRLQPRRGAAELQSSWAENLAGRLGWHGVRTTTAVYWRLLAAIRCLLAAY